MTEREIETERKIMTEREIEIKSLKIEPETKIEMEQENVGDKMMKHLHCSQRRVVVRGTEGPAEIEIKIETMTETEVQAKQEEGSRV